MIGNHPFRCSAINEQQRPMFAAASGVRSAGIAHWQEQEVGCIILVLVFDDRLQGCQKFELGLGPAQQVGHGRPHEPRPRGQIRIVGLPFLLQEHVIRRDMLVTQPFRGAELQPTLRRDARSGRLSIRLAQTYGRLFATTPLEGFAKP